MTTSALAFDLPALPGRPLSEEELKALVGQLADRPELWQNRVAFDTGGRHFASSTAMATSTSGCCAGIPSMTPGGTTTTLLQAL